MYKFGSYADLSYFLCIHTVVVTRYTLLSPKHQTNQTTNQHHHHLALLKATNITTLYQTTLGWHFSASNRIVGEPRSK